MCKKSETRVVNIKNEEFDVYIGRGSMWGNPFIIGYDGNREEVIKKYEFHLAANKEMLDKLPELKGKRLGCYCAPLPCHGDILKKWVDQL